MSIDKTVITINMLSCNLKKSLCCLRHFKCGYILQRTGIIVIIAKKINWRRKAIKAVIETQNAEAILKVALAWPRQGRDLPPDLISLSKLTSEVFDSCDGRKERQHC